MGLVYLYVNNSFLNKLFVFKNNVLYLKIYITCWKVFKKEPIIYLAIQDFG